MESKSIKFTNREIDYQIPINSGVSKWALKVIEEIGNFTIDGHIHLHCFFNDVSN